MSTGLAIEELRADDYDEVLALWQKTPGVGLSDADSRAGIEQFLARNPGLSLVARDGATLVGTVLCGHDGRRGYLHHLAVRESHRRRGVARDLVGETLRRLRDLGIAKCHVFILSDNDAGLAFWREVGFAERIELTMMSDHTGC